MRALCQRWQRDQQTWKVELKSPIARKKLSTKTSESYGFGSDEKGHEEEWLKKMAFVIDDITTFFCARSTNLT